MEQMSDGGRRIALAETGLRSAALTWHYLAGGPDEVRGRQAAEDLHAACAELVAALEDAENQGQQGRTDEDDPERQDQASTHT